MDNSHFIRTTQVNQTKRNEKDQKLRSEMTTNDRKIDELQTQIRDLQHNTDIELQKKKEEIQKLKERIIGLEEENKELKERLTKTEADNIDLNHEMITLKEDNTDIKNKINTLEKDFKEFKDKCWTSEEDIAKLFISEMCKKIQSLIYKQVNPDHYDPNEPYKVKNILKDIDQDEPDDVKNEEAKQRWEQLQEKLRWHKKYETAMKSIQIARNEEVAHPELEENLLRNYAKSLQETGWLQSRSRRKPKLVFELIDIWKNLVELEN